jgi:hypothetical protein
MNPDFPQKFPNRVLLAMQGHKPDRIPFISRMDFWFRGLSYQDKIPEPYNGMTLSEIHNAIGFGQEDWFCPCAYKYKNMELVLKSEGQEILHVYEPEISYFPDLWGIVPVDHASETTTEMITPVGKLVFKHRILEESIRTGTTRPQMIEHPIRTPDDFHIYEYIIEHSEFVPYFDAYLNRSKELNGSGFLVPMLNRVPFQSLLIEAIGEVPFFYALADTPQLIYHLLDVVDHQILDMLEHLTGFSVPYVEFGDNLEGSMTNPRLFQKFLIPYYQHYSEILHQQGKKLGSHTDGNLKKLVTLLPESGLDVCESFTPAPITECTFEEAWAAWEKGPLIWGGIPSYYLEATTPEDQFQKRIDALLELVRDRPIILGIGDAVMSNNEIERVRWIAQRVENFEL